MFDLTLWARPPTLITDRPAHQIDDRVQIFLRGVRSHHDDYQSFLSQELTAHSFNAVEKGQNRLLQPPTTNRRWHRNASPTLTRRNPAHPAVQLSKNHSERAPTSYRWACRVAFGKATSTKRPPSGRACAATRAPCAVAMAMDRPSPWCPSVPAARAAGTARTAGPPVRSAGACRCWRRRRRTARP